MTESLTAEKDGNSVDYGTLEVNHDTFLQAVTHNLPELRERFLLRLLQGNTGNIGNIRLQAQQLQIPQGGYLHCVCMITAIVVSSMVSADAVLCSLREKINNYAVARGLTVFCCIDLQNRLNCIISDTIDKANFEFEHKVIEEICKTAEEPGVELFCAVGPAVDRLELLSESSNLAKLSIERSMTLKTAGTDPKYETQYRSIDDIHKYLLQLFRNGDIDTIINTVRQHVDSIRLDTPGRQVLIERFVVLYLQNITNECMRLGVTLERFESYVPAVVCLMQLDSTGSVEAVLQLTEQILKYVSVHRTNEGNHLLNMAKDYILENIGNERLDLATVSDHVGLSRVYFCKLFHQLEGISFSAYIKKVRIEKAKQLLLTTNMKVFEVSNAVGFSHAKYFGHVFKETVGQTPVEFQRSTYADS